MDFEQLDLIGPLAQVLYWVCQFTEEYREDKVMLGTELEDSPVGYFNCSAVYFRACSMK